MKNEFDVIAFGEILIDFAPYKTKDDGYPVVEANPGGAPANFLAALAKYGAETAFIGKVGNDQFGHLLLSTLKEAGIYDGGVIVSDDVFTTLAFVSIDKGGDRSFSFARKPGADTCITWDEVDVSIIDRARAFHFGTLSMTDEPSRSALMRACEYARWKGKLITFDPNLRRPLWDDLSRARDAIEWGLHMADVVKISDDEVGFMWDCTADAGACRLINEYGVRVAMVTCGADGCVMRTKNAYVNVPAVDVNTIDTTGAGDIFGGSAVWGLLPFADRIDDITESELLGIARFASAASSLSTEVTGGIPSIPDIEKVKNTVKSAF